METKKSNLKLLLKETFIKKIITTCQNILPSENFKLILDGLTTKIVSSFISMSELTYLGIPVINDVSQERSKLKFPPIYFVHSCKESLKHILDDYFKNTEKALQKNKKLKKRSNCAKAFFFFTTKISDEDFELIKLIPVKYILCLYETNFFHVTTEERVFTIPTTLPLKSLSKKEDVLEQSNRLSDIVTMLYSLFVCLQEVPVVCFRKSNLDGQKMGHELLRRLNIAENEGLLDPVGTKSSGDQTKKLENLSLANKKKYSTPLLFIIERLEDIPTIFMHQFTYQSILYDIFEIDSLYRVLDGKSNDVCINPTKKTWRENRFLHISKVSKQLYEELNEFAKLDQSNREKLNKTISSKESAENYGKSKRGSLSDLQAVVRAIPKQKELINDYQNHLKIISMIFEKIDNNKIADIARIMHTIGTGLDDGGKPVATKKIAQKMLELEHPNKLSNFDKIRVSLLFFLYCTDEEVTTNKKKIFDFFQFSKQEQEFILNFRIEILKRLGDNFPTPVEIRTSMKSTFLDETDKQEFEFMQWKPKLTQTLETFLKKGKFEASKKQFDYLGQKEKFESAFKVCKIHGKKNKTYKTELDFSENSLKIVVFITENVTYAEIKEIYELGNKYNITILVGSESTINANEFIKSFML